MEKEITEPGDSAEDTTLLKVTMAKAVEPLHWMAEFTL